MSSINPASIHTFNNGDVVVADDLNISFSTIVAAVNDNYATIQSLSSGTSYDINVKASPYNAVGDGVADDTAAIQAAIVAAQASGRGVFLPAGAYRTTATLNLAGGGIRLYGIYGESNIYATNETVQILSIPSGTGTSTSGTSIENLRLYYAGLVAPTSNKVIIDISGTAGASHLTIRNCVFNASIYAGTATFGYPPLHSIRANSWFGLTIDDCIFSDESTAIMLQATSHVTIKDCEFLNLNGGAGISVQTQGMVPSYAKSPYQYFDSGASSSGVSIINNKFYNAQFACISLFRARHTTLIGNQFYVENPATSAGMSPVGVIRMEGVATSAAPVESANEWCVHTRIIGNSFSVNNTANQCWFPAISVESGSRDLSIVGNVIRRLGLYTTTGYSQYSGTINLQYTENVVISGNTFRQIGDNIVCINLYIANYAFNITGNTFVDSYDLYLGQAPVVVRNNQFSNDTNGMITNNYVAYTSGSYGYLDVYVGTDISNVFVSNNRFNPSFTTRPNLITQDVMQHIELSQWMG